jgi:hypothetical protein
LGELDFWESEWYYSVKKTIGRTKENISYSRIFRMDIEDIYFHL